MRYSVGFIARNQKLFQYSDRDAQEYTLAAVRTLLSAQPELFEDMIALDWSQVDAIANDDGTVSIRDKSNPGTVRLRLPESISIQSLRDTITEISALVSENKTAIETLQETISGVADALDAI